ncbi:MAG: hypothetical protein U0637_04260 [Phycisphaerales bacterium]
MRLGQGGFRAVVVGCLAVGACGCTTKSLQPAYTRESQVVEQGVLGRWANDAGTVTLDVRREDSRYTVGMTLRGDKPDGSDDKAVELEGVLFRAGGVLLCDASLSDTAWEATGLAKEFTVRTHAVCRVELSDGTMTIRELKSASLEQELANGAAGLDHLDVPGDGLVLSAGPESMLAFLARHGADGSFFNDADAARKFKRAGGPTGTRPEAHP